MSFATPSNGYRLEGASLRNSYAAGRDLTNSVTSLEVRVTALKTRADTIAGSSGVSMGSLGEVRSYYDEGR